jgi:hypothetical protein
LAGQGAIAAAPALPGAYVQQSDLLYDKWQGLDEREDPFDAASTVL